MKKSAVWMNLLNGIENVEKKEKRFVAKKRTNTTRIKSTFLAGKQKKYTQISKMTITSEKGNKSLSKQRFRKCTIF